jgi:polysaccharide deacetylase family protein (PEP-CTERM system associated)
VDVEDYFQVSALEPHFQRQDWDRVPARVQANTARILDMLAAHDVKATFFVLGWVAERYPELVRRLIAEGHEVASHGYHHQRVTQQTPDEFRADVARAKALLEDIAGCPVLGYRAPSYSIGAKTLWALELLNDVGYRYSSSIFPIHHDLYGMPDAPRFPFYPRENGILEIPVTTVSMAGTKLPCGGGGYFRLLPYGLYKWALKRVNTVDGRPGVFYFHPWEIDPDQPRVPGVTLKTRVRHYINLDKMQRKVERLLRDFHWSRMDEVFLESSRRYPMIGWTDREQAFAV